MKNKNLSPSEAIKEYIRQDVCGTLRKVEKHGSRMEIPYGRVNLKEIYENCLECSSYDKRQVKKCHITECPLWPFRMGNNPNRKGVGNKNAKLNLPQNKNNGSSNENHSYDKLIRKCDDELEKTNKESKIIVLNEKEKRRN